MVISYVSSPTVYDIQSCFPFNHGTVLNKETSEKLGYYRVIHLGLRRFIHNR